MEAIEAIHSRRTIRAFRADSVDRSLLKQILWAAVQAPTPPISGAAAHEHQPPGQRWTWTERPDFKVFWNAPAVVLFYAKATNPEAPFDCCRAAQNMLIAAHALGLGTCWIGAPIPWLVSPGVNEELGVPTGYDASVAVLIGYAAEQPVGEPRPEPEVLWC